MIPVLAGKAEIIGGIKIKPFGIKELKDISVLNAKKAVKSACFEYKIRTIRNKSLEILDKANSELNKSLSEEIKKKLEIIEGRKTSNEIIDDLNNLLIKIISKYIYNNKRRYIIVFSKDIINESLSKFNKDFNSFIKKQIGEVIKDKKKKN